METQSLEFKGLKRRPQNTYINGNTVTKPSKKEEDKKLRALPKEIKKYGISGKVLLTGFYILCIALFVGSILMYINLQSELATSVDEIASLQNRYESEKRMNDQELAAINNSIDNEEIRRIAIDELGMHYASDGQIVIYSEQANEDFVRVNTPIK